MTSRGDLLTCDKWIDTAPSERDGCHEDIKQDGNRTAARERGRHAARDLRPRRVYENPRNERSRQRAQHTHRPRGRKGFAFEERKGQCWGRRFLTGKFSASSVS